MAHLTLVFYLCRHSVTHTKLLGVSIDILILFSTTEPRQKKSKYIQKNSYRCAPREKTRENNCGLLSWNASMAEERVAER